MAEIDEVKMTLVLTNLIENAVKYNKEHGKVNVTLDADHQNFTVTVEDTGIGIPEDSIDRIYERFYRVDKSRSREVGGTGLGLAITKNAVLLHRGTIKVRSKLGEGSIFTVTIPLMPASGAGSRPRFRDSWNTHCRGRRSSSAGHRQNCTLWSTRWRKTAQTMRTRMSKSGSAAARQNRMRKRKNRI